MHFKSFTCGLVLVAAMAAGGSTIAAPSPDHVAALPAALVQARDDLRISELTLRRIDRNLKRLREQAAADPLGLLDYERYRRAVAAMAERQRAVVRDMEAVHGLDALMPATNDWPTVEPTDFAPAPPAVDDELALLDRELAVSLASFDQYLLQEQLEASRRMERIDAASSEAMTTLAQEAAAAVERLRDRGIDVDTGMPPAREDGEHKEGDREEDAPAEDAPRECRDGNCGACADCTGAGGGADENATTRPGGGGVEDGPGSGGDEEPAPGAPGTPGAPGARDGGTGGGASGDGTGVEPPPGGGTGADGEGGTTVPPERDRPPATDDDIVARQLREAAERETDPVLREKLWREYERYKGTR